MRLDNLQRDLMAMTSEERRQFILKVRADRRIKKESPTKRKDTAKKKDKVQDMIAGMSDAEREALIAKLQEANDGS